MIDESTKQNIAEALWVKEYDDSLIPKNILEKIKGEKNSNAQFTKRFKARIQALIDNKLSFTPSFDNRYKIMMENANNLSPQQCYVYSSLLGPESVTGYDKIPIHPTFNFTEINAPQWKNQLGWHFFVGNFIDEESNHYSVQFMFCQYTLLPPPLAEHFNLTDIENQILELHLAVSDQKNNIHYRAAPVIVAGTTGLINFSAKPFSYSLGKNSIVGTNPNGDLSQFKLTARGWDKGKIPQAEIEISLHFKNDTGYFLQGEEGCYPSIDGIGTLYYSAANIKLDDLNENLITLNNKKIKLVHGNLWYDHQWTAGFMPTATFNHSVMRAFQYLKTPTPAGWDWFMIQFHRDKNISDEEVQMTIAALHSHKNKIFYGQSGKKTPKTMTEKLSGKYIDAKNNAINITGIMKITEWVKSISSPNASVYPCTNTWYPAKFEFTIDGDLPDTLKTFTLTPTISHGQSGFFAFGVQYSEGGAVVTNINGEEIGRGFAESTGYMKNSDALLALAGLPINPETISFLKAPTLPLWRKVIALIYIIFHVKKLKEIMATKKGI